MPNASQTWGREEAEKREKGGEKWATKREVDICFRRSLALGGIGGAVGAGVEEEQAGALRSIQNDPSANFWPQRHCGSSRCAAFL